MKDPEQKERPSEELDPRTAEQILGRVLDSCDRRPEPGSVSVLSEKLDRSRARRKGLRLALIASAAVLLAALWILVTQPRPTLAPQAAGDERVLVLASGARRHRPGPRCRCR